MTILMKSLLDHTPAPFKKNDTLNPENIQDNAPPLTKVQENKVQNQVSKNPFFTTLLWMLYSLKVATHYTALSP